MFFKPLVTIGDWLMVGSCKGYSCDEKDRDYAGRFYTLRLGKVLFDLSITRRERSR